MLLKDVFEIEKWWDSELNQVGLSTVTAFSNKKFFFKCSKNHSFTTTAGKFTSGRRCPYCSNRILLRDFNDLETIFLKLSEEWSSKNIKKASEVFSQTNKKYWWRCSKCNFEWEQTPNNRAKGKGCPACKNRECYSGFNDLKTMYPELAKEAVGINPSLITAGTDEKISWKCSKGHIWKAQINSRIKGAGCPKCSRRVSKGEKELLKSIKTFYNGKIEENWRGVTGIELDLYFPELRKAIEYNGEYWHSNRVVSQKSGISNIQYHRDKIELAKSHNIELIYVWENDWITNKEIVLKNLENWINGTGHSWQNRLESILD